MTLRLRLSLAFLFVVVAPLLVATIVVGQGLPSALDDEATTRVASSRAAAAALLDETCERVRLAAEVLARQAVAGHGAAGAARAANDVVDRRLADYAVVSLGAAGPVRSAGSVPASGRPLPAALGSCSRDVAPAAEAPVIADSVVVAADGRTTARAAVAVDLNAALVQRLSTDTNADVSLLAGERVVASSTRLDADALRQVAAQPGHKPITADGRLAASTLLPGRGAVLVLSVDRPGVGGLEVLLVAVLLAALLLSALIGWLLARVTTRPLAELSAAAARVAAGDLDTRIETSSRDEIGQLAHAFNEMTEELREHVRALEASRDQLRNNLARLGDTLSSTHDLGRIMTVILDTAIASVQATAGAAYVIQPGRDELLLRAGRGLERRAAAARLPVGTGVTGTVATTGEAVRGRAGAEGIELSELEPKADELISVPMRTGSGVLGVVNLYDRIDGQPFDSHDLDTIRTFAGQAAVAVDNVLLHQEAQRLSVTDALTGLGNYRFFQSTLTREIERAARFGRQLALLMLDLDLFKEVNDVHGHEVGNGVLMEVGERIRAQVREVDVVARYGGEEFAVVLPETDPDGAGLTAARICGAVRAEPFQVNDLVLRVTVSAGAAVFPVHADGAAALVRAADEALYAAKAAGRDRWRMATGSAEPDPSLASPS